MKINYALVSRILIALLFVIAGVQKVTSFNVVASYISSLGFPLPALVAGIVVLIEIPVAVMFAWGYRTRTMGLILIGFTIIVTLIVHKNISDGTNVAMALKNIAIIGGILASMYICECGKCGQGKCLPRSK